MIGSEVENSTSVLASDPLLLQAESVDDAQLLPSVSATYPYRDETGTSGSLVTNVAFGRCLANVRGNGHDRDN